MLKKSHLKFNSACHLHVEILSLRDEPINVDTATSEHQDT